MLNMLLTADQGMLLGPIAKILGVLMEWIFEFLDLIGIPNIGLTIILFTIVIYLLLMPLTVKQQKFSKLSAKMNPELQAVQAKYKGKKDSESMAAMNEETQAVYAKYGVSPTGSCLQLLIQMPILFALYRVIYAIPAYVSKVGNVFGVLADKIIETDGGKFLQNSGVDSIARAVTQYNKNFELDGNTKNAIIDVLNKISSSDMATIASKYNLTDLQYNGNLILSNDTTRGLLDVYNNFLGINIANSPSAIIGEAFQGGNGIQFGLLISAILIPLLAALTQWINVKLMPQQQPTGDNAQADSVASSMKMMNNVMPIMSAVFCFSLPAGMGIYWIAGAVVRTIQQIVINKHIDKMDIDEMIKKNQEKQKKKMEKAGIDPNALSKNTSVNTRRLSNAAQKSSSMSEKDREEALKKANDYYNNNAKPGSIAAKANMVKNYNERNNK